MLVQTFSPDHPAIMAAVKHDYNAFALFELPIRESLDYPPFAAMIRLLVRGPVELAAGQFAEAIATLLRDELTRAGVQARILGPAPAPLAKLRGNFRFQIQVQGADGAGLRQAVRQATSDLKPPEDVQWIADVDPLDML